MLNKQEKRTNICIKFASRKVKSWPWASNLDLQNSIGSATTTVKQSGETGFRNIKIRERERPTKWRKNLPVPKRCGVGFSGLFRLRYSITIFQIFPNGIKIGKQTRISCLPLTVGRFWTVLACVETNKRGQCYPHNFPFGLKSIF